MIEQGNFVKLRHPFAPAPTDSLGSCSDDDHRETWTQTSDIVAFVALVAIAVVVANLNCVAGDVVDRG